MTFVEMSDLALIGLTRSAICGFLTFTVLLEFVTELSFTVTKYCKLVYPKKGFDTILAKVEVIALCISTARGFFLQKGVVDRN